MAKKTNGKPKAKNLLPALQDECVALHNEMLMNCVDDAIDVTLRGFYRKLDRLDELVITLKNNLDFPNDNVEEVVNSIFNEYTEISKSIQDVDCGKLCADIFDDISEYREKTDAIIDYFREKALRLPFIPEDRLIKCDIMLQRTYNSQFAKYWRMSIQQLCHDLNERFLYVQGLMMQQLQRFKVVEHEVEVVSEEEDVTVVKYKKITDRKELEQLARNNGFELKRQTGSHRIYENENGKVTVIADHTYDIGKGMSHKIQKQILQ